MHKLLNKHWHSDQCVAARWNRALPLSTRNSKTLCTGVLANINSGPWRQKVWVAPASLLGGRWGEVRGMKKRHFSRFHGGIRVLDSSASSHQKRRSSRWFIADVSLRVSRLRLFLGREEYLHTRRNVDKLQGSLGEYKASDRSREALRCILLLQCSLGRSVWEHVWKFACISARRQEDNLGLDVLEAQGAEKVRLRPDHEISFLRIQILEQPRKKNTHQVRQITFLSIKNYRYWGSRLFFTFAWNSIRSSSQFIVHVWHVTSKKINGKLMMCEAAVHDNLMKSHRCGGLALAQEMQQL